MFSFVDTVLFISVNGVCFNFSPFHREKRNGKLYGEARVLLQTGVCFSRLRINIHVEMYLLYVNK